MIWAVGLAVNTWWREYNMTILIIIACVMAGLIFLQGVAKAVKANTKEAS